MKQGKTLSELAAEVERQASAKRDALVQTQSLRLNTNGRSLLWLGGDDPFTMQPLTHRQMGDHLGVPYKWYDALLNNHDKWLVDGDGPNLFDTTMNTLLKARPEDERRLVRTLDGNARAFLSDKYRPIDHLPILMSVLPVLQDEPGIDWANASMEVTDNKLYLQVVNKDLQAEIKPGTHERRDIVSGGVVISNSEVGLGAFRVQPMLFRLVCSNGLIITEESRAKYHVGGALGSDGEAFQWLADDTIAARNAATIKEMRDVVRASLNDVIFQKAVDSAREAAGVPIQGDPVKAVEWVTDRFGLYEAEQTGVLRNLIEGHDLSLWGMVNAVTATANTHDSYDRAVELEALGGKLLALPKPDLKALAYAA